MQSRSKQSSMSHWLLVLSVLTVCLMFPHITAAKAVTIRYGCISTSWEQAVLDRFNDIYEGRIFVEGAPMDDDSLKVAIAGGAAPSLARVDRFEVGSYASSGFLRPLDDFIARDQIKAKDYFPPTWQECIFNGRVYALPRNTDTRAMWYNKTLFEQAGLDGNRPPRTWEELSEYSSKLTRSDGEKLVQVGFAPQWGNFYFFGWLWLAGGDLVDSTNRKVTWDSEEGRRTLTWMREWVDRYGKAELDVFVSKLKGDKIYSGKLGMELNTVSRVTDLVKAPQWEWGVAYPPRPAGLESTPMSWSGGHGLAIPEGAPHVEEAWEFIKFYIGREGQTLVGQAAPRMPVLASTAASPEFQKVSPYMRTFVELMAYSRFRPIVPVPAELYEIYRREITNMMLSNVPVGEILDDTARRGQQILDQGWAQYGQ